MIPGLARPAGVPDSRPPLPIQRQPFLPAGRAFPPWGGLDRHLLPFPLAFFFRGFWRGAAIGAQVVLRQMPGRDHQLNVGDAEVRCSPAQHPGRRVFLVLVDGLVEINLVQVAADRQSVQGDVLLATLALQILAEVHRPYLQKPSAKLTRATSPHYRYRPAAPPGVSRLMTAGSSPSR